MNIDISKHHRGHRLWGGVGKTSPVSIVYLYAIELRTKSKSKNMKTKKDRKIISLDSEKKCRN